VSTVVRRLGNADDVAFSTGLGGVDATTYGTIAVLFRPSADTVFRWLVKLYDATGGDLGGVGLLSDGTTFWKGASIWATEGPSVTFDDWHLLIARKNTGDVRPRFSLKNVTTGIWVHDDAVDTQLDWVAPTGGSIRTKDATSGEGPGADYAAAAIWADELPWAADTFGDAAIEAAGLDEHLDNWRDADPASGWEFSQSDANYMVEDFTLNRADETSFGVGTPTTVTDLDFVYATAGILALSRNFLRDTQDEPGATGIIHDLSETQGTPTTIGSGSISSGSFIKVLEFWRVVGTTVDASVAIDTSISMAAVSAATLRYQWIVHRYNSSDVLQESSTASSEHNTTGVKTQTMVLAGPFAAGDKLSVSLWLKKAGGGGSRSFTLNINNADSWVEFSVAETPPLEITPAAVTIDATPGTLTITSTVGFTPAPVTVTATPGTATITTTATITPAPVTVTATPGTVEVATEGGSQPVTPAPVTVTCTAGTLTVTIGAVNLVPDPATITATPGTLTLTATVDVIPDPVTVSATPGTLVLTATADIVPAVVVVDASPGTLTVTTSAPGQDITPDPVTVAVTGGILAVGQGLTVFPATITVAATPGVLTMTTGPVDITPAVVSLTATPGTLAIGLGLDLVDANVDVDPGALTITAGSVDITPAAVSITVTPGLVVLAILALELDLGGASIAVTAGALTVATDEIIPGTLVATAPRSGLVATAPTATMGGR
jgi:hypothetical protein